MSNFISSFWESHGARWDHDLVVRFPPEPNGFLHLGHLKAVLANADLAKSFGGRMLLRMDDTNPAAERAEYERAIKDDLDWLGIHFDGPVVYASDHFEDLKALAWKMVGSGEAYVDIVSPEEMSRRRGTLTRPGVASSDRSLPPEEHARRFARLLEGALGPGEAVLRAKMDMASPNVLLRDPVLWRGLDVKHPRAPGWVSFPSYDFAHPFCDLRDGITLSLCSLEFENHKPIYNHVVESAIRHGFGLGKAAPEELEFARLSPDVGPTSKRVLRAAVEEGVISGWDDPRLLTIAGLRARGYPAESILSFVRRCGVSRAESVAPLAWLDEEVRSAVGNTPAGLVVVDPVLLRLSGSVPRVLKLPEEREMACSTEFWVGRDDCRRNEMPGFHRLSPGKTVRLLGLGGFARVDKVHADECGNIVEVEATFLAEGKAKATVHVLPVDGSIRAEIEHVHTWDGSSPAAGFWPTLPAAVEPAAWASSGLIHAPRVGWGFRVGKRWRRLAAMSRSPSDPLSPIEL